MMHAVIIAGGRGERLGRVRKADLLFGGRRLVDHVAEALGDVQSLMVAIGPMDDGRGAMARAIRVEDLRTDVAGPLAGLAAAVHALQRNEVSEGLLISAAVDAPLLPHDVADRLAAALGSAAAAYAAWGDQFYPPNGLWRLEALQDLPAQVLSGGAPQSLKALLQALHASRVDWQKFARADPFLNINTVADLVRLQRMARI